MLRNLIQLWLIVLFLNPEIYAMRNFASSADLKMLLKTEEQVLKTLKNYVKAEKKRLNFLEKYVARSKLEYEIAIKDVPHYLGNPINAYTIIKRLGPDLEFVEQILRNKTELKTPNAVFPTEEDMKNSILGVMSILTVYGLNVSQMANGILNSTARASQEIYSEAVTPMTASDCYTIGMDLYRDEAYNYALPWLEEAYKRVEGVPCDICPVDIIEVIDHIAHAYHELDDMKNFMEWAEKRIFLRPNDPESMVQAKFIDALRHKENVEEKKEKEETKPMKNVKKTQYSGTFTDVCLGPKQIYITKKSMHLSCKYAHGPHPVLKLAPLKAELLHQDPDITMFHSLLSDEEIEDLITISTPALNWNTTHSDRPDFRNAEAITLDDAFPTVSRASRRALDLSGLSPEGSENLKVVSYGIGGYYRRHWDSRQVDYGVPLPAPNTSLPRDYYSTTPRYASIVFYLTEVEQGGATVFPLLDLTIFPKKGAALFWMNMLPSGLMDALTMHAACPVVRGAKWIKWPHHFSEEWCPIWKIGNRVVTSEMYKKILIKRAYKFSNMIGNEKMKMTLKDFIHQY